MSDAATTIFALQRNWDMVSTAVAGVDDATLASMPNDQSNSIAWLVWHMTRVADRFIHSRFQDTGQLWTDGGLARQVRDGQPIPMSSASAGAPSRSRTGPALPATC